MNKNLRIACYGLVKKNGGSGSGGQFFILEELLKRGVEIDFYGRKDYIYPQELLEYNNFKLFHVRRTLLSYLADLIPGANNLVLVRSLQAQWLKQKVFYNHQYENYNLLFILEQPSQFKIDSIPSISWIQGSPQSSWYFILKLRKQIISLCGLDLYLKLKFFYALKARLAKYEIPFSDFIICASQWTKEQLIEYGLKPKSIKVLPYPIDVNFFKLNSARPNKTRSDSKVFLWLGRSEPRKRLDLLLEAYGQLLQERQDVQLKIIGGFAWAPGYKKLIDRFELPEYLEYQPSIDKAKVPELMAQCDLLIQPSEGENFGSSVAEALCCGLPVIVGPTNGTKDFISSSSFVFEEYTPESLKKTMFEAIEAIEQKREKLALDARANAEKNFNISNIVDSLESIFQESIELKRQKTLEQ